MGKGGRGLGQQNQVIPSGKGQWVEVEKDKSWGKGTQGIIDFHNILC